MSAKVNFVKIPQELKNNASFCVWKLEKRKGKATKVPYDPRTGQLARTNDAATFSDFGTAMKAYAMGGWDGIGYRVSEGIGAIDIDHCIREDGSLNDVAASILGIFSDAYFERSPSGTGLRGFLRLSPDFAYDKTIYYINNRRHGLEVYLPGTTNRFVTVTGDEFRAGTVTRNDEALQTLLDTFMKRKNQVKVSDYLDYHYCYWTSYGDDAATDMMHTKACAVSAYTDMDGVDHHYAVWTSSANLDGVNANATNGNDKLQTGSIVWDDYKNVTIHKAGEKNVSINTSSILKGEVTTPLPI